jgi:hypothetical protein
MSHVIVWDVETVPDLAGYAAANGHDGKSDDEIRAELGEKFPKHIYHSIICIGALIAHRDNDHWVVEALGAPHVGERSEKELIAAAGRGTALARARPDRNRWPRGDVIRIRFRSGREAAYQPSKRDPAFHYSLLSDASVWFAAGRVGFSRYLFILGEDFVSHIRRLPLRPAAASGAHGRAVRPSHRETRRPGCRPYRSPSETRAEG